MFQITSRATIYKWRQTRGFPEPITLMPLRWLRSAAEEWKDNTCIRFEKAVLEAETILVKDRFVSFNNIQ